MIVSNTVVNSDMQLNQILYLYQIRLNVYLLLYDQYYYKYNLFFIIHRNSCT